MACRLIGTEPLSEPMQEYRLIGTLRINFREILIRIQAFSSKEMHLKMDSAKWRPFHLGPNVLMILKYTNAWYMTGLDIKHLAYMPIGHVVLKTDVPCKNFHVPSQYSYKPCKAYVYCWKNKYMPRLKNHLPSRASNHKSLSALGQNLHAPGPGHTLMSSPVWRNCKKINQFLY